LKLIVQPADGVAPLVKAIKQAKKSVEIVIFRFDEAEIEHALEDAAQRGVFVHALIAFTNRGGEKNLRKLEMRFLEKGITVARTADDLVRYHGKMMIVDGRDLYLLTYNFTHLDTERSRSFGIATRNRELVKEASRLFECDTKRQPYSARCDKFVVSPVNARPRLMAFVKGAKEELLIYDVDIADKETMRILQERTQAGVKIRVIGHISRNKHLGARAFRRMRLHTRVIIRDCKQAFLGSQSLRKLELDARREIGIIVNNAKVVSSLVTVFEDDWKASVPTDRRAEKKRLTAKAAKASKTVSKAVSNKLSPVPIAQHVVMAIKKETNVEIDREEATAQVRVALKKAVKKATERIVEEAIAD
jgi:phosphatidylserine/phosphatidylglycerophosphate/cardiolipin synthase-like enzyme